MTRYFFAMLLMGVTFYTASIYESTAIALLGYVQAFFVVLSLGYLLYEMRGLKMTLELAAAMADQGQPVLVRAQGRMRYRGCYGKIRVRVSVKREGGGRKRKWLAAEAPVKGALWEPAGMLTADMAGYYEIRLERLRVYDMTGLFYLSSTGAVSGQKAALAVLPRVCPIGIRLSEAVCQFSGEAEVYDTFRSGEDAAETHDLRAFQNGDKLRNIHWKLSAKSGELIVRENSRPRGCPLVILVEAAGGIGEAQLQCVASISFTLMDLECPHYVAWRSRQWQDVVRIRVDDEESYYECLLQLLQDGNDRNPMDIALRYREKYSSEQVIHYLRIGSRPSIQVDNQEVRCLKASAMEESLRELELLL